MTEEQVSEEMFRAARADSHIDLLSWQSVDGKNYFAFDIKLRLPTQERIEPDLILRTEDAIWLIEVKGTHAEALADETKLVMTVDLLGEDEIVTQIYRRAGLEGSDVRPVQLAVAYGDDTDVPAEACEPLVHHLGWVTMRDDDRPLSDRLRDAAVST